MGFPGIASTINYTNHCFQILEDYASQIHHLQKELVTIQKEFDEAQEAVGASVH